METMMITILSVDKAVTLYPRITPKPAPKPMVWVAAGDYLLAKRQPLPPVIYLPAKAA